ncbi:MAG: hypothetical protein R6V58_10645 [Planctomycetota bacterium]
MNHLETLVFQWLDYRRYIVRPNIRVGRMQQGGHRGELDIVAYHPIIKHCLHAECSTDARSWAHREKQFQKKFGRGRETIPTEVFPWIEDIDEIEQWAVIWGIGGGRRTVGGGKVVPLKTLYHNIARDVRRLNKKGHRVFPEKYSHLRTIQAAMRYIGDEIDEEEEGTGTEWLLPDTE